MVISAKKIKWTWFGGTLVFVCVSDSETKVGRTSDMGDVHFLSEHPYF